MNPHELEEAFQEYWDRDGIRFLVEGNRVPTPFDRSRHAFFAAYNMASKDFQLPDDCYITAIEVEEVE
jgi:hypothetical protein